MPDLACDLHPVTYLDNQSHLPHASGQPSEVIQGVVERLTYHSEESGYTVARLKAPRSSDRQSKWRPQRVFWC